MASQWSMHAELITAPGDGLGPALLLTLGARLKAQYLFNIPEGFSRFVLEHKLRPGLGLRAVFVSDLLSATGLPGLIMRLRGEGHGSIELFGPKGTLPFTSSLRHFVHWKHPAVLISEHHPQQQQHDSGEGGDGGDGGYDDEHLSVCILSNLETTWKPPPWLRTESREEKNTSDVIGSSSGESAGSSDESESSSSESEAAGTKSEAGTSSDNSSSSSSSGSSDEDSSSDSASDSGNNNNGENKHDDKEQRFSALDKIFAPGGAGGSAARHQALGQLQTTPASAQPLAWTLQALQAARRADGSWHVAGREYVPWGSAEVPVYSRKAQKQQQPQQNGGGSAGVHQQPQQQPSSLLAFLGHVKAKDTIILIASLKSVHDLECLQRHPALADLSKQPSSRIAAMVFFAAPEVAQCTLFSELLASLPGPKYLLEHLGPGGASDLGFLSSTRTTARLGVVSKRIFPLPFILRTPRNQEELGSSTQPVAPLGSSVEAATVHRVTQTARLTWDSLGVPHLTELSTSDDGTTPIANIESLQTEVLEALPHLKATIQALVEQSPELGSDPPPPRPPPPPPPPPPPSAPAQEQAQDPSFAKRRKTEEAETSTLPSNESAAAQLKASLQNRGASLQNEAGEQERQRTGTETSIFRPQHAPHAHQQQAHPEVTFLGTGSAEPSKYRGASAIHLSIGNGRGALLDCGEGAWGQLVRQYGADAATSLVALLACVWVSHRHADHMAGVLQILTQYPKSSPPLLLIGPRALENWLREAAPAVGLPPYSFVHCAEMRNPLHWAHAALHSSLGIVSSTCISVRHCSDSYGIVMRHEAGWSVVYSGDTQPCEALVRAGRGATLLIHEATFEPALVGEARKKRHSTTSEAVEVAVRMGAYRTILTHFSQRYPKCPEVILEGGNSGGSSVAVAFDGMRVPFSLLEQLPAVTLAAAEALQGPRDAAAEEGKAAA